MENPKLFIGNLNFETTKEDINDLFAPFGTILRIRLRPKKGFAFVEMSTPEEAATAIKTLDQQEFKGRLLRITPELTKKQAKAVTRQRFRERKETADEMT